MTVLPTGRQTVVTRGDSAATVVEVGGALRSYRAAGRELLDGWGEAELPTGYRGGVLVPWPNRLRDGRYAFDGEEHQTALTEPETATALHGLATDVAWTPVRHSASEVAVEHLLHPRRGYPFTLRVRVTYALGAEGLTVRTEATNVGTRPLPYGAGHHPYLAAAAAGTDLVDGCRLELGASSYVVGDARGLPVEVRPVAGTPFDFREGRVVGDLRLDSAFTDLRRDDDGLARVRLTGPDGRGAAVWLDATYRWVQVFSGDTLPEPGRRRRGLAVEPMTCPPDALATGQDVLRLEPGESVSGSWGITPL